MNTDTVSTITIPGFYLPHIEKYVLDKGGDVEALYKSAALDPLHFKPDQSSLSEEQFYSFISEALCQTGGQHFGLEIGRCFNLVSFGLLSKAGMSCANVGEVIQVVERYSGLAMPLLRLTSHETDTLYIIELNLVSQYFKLNQIIAEAFIVSSHKVLSLLTGQDIQLERLSLSFAEPSYASQYPASYSKHLEFNANKNLMVFNKRVLALDCITANPVDAQTALAECESRLRKNKQTHTLSDQVVQCIRSSLESSHSEALVANELNLSERSLRRKLADAGTSYRELLRQTREEMAIYYLSQTNLQISQIAWKLGYQESSNFRAAFKTWTGISPKQWRQNNRRA